jgi:hypothetical protein
MVGGARAGARDGSRVGWCEANGDERRAAQLGEARVSNGDRSRRERVERTGIWCHFTPGEFRA